MPPEPEADLVHPDTPFILIQLAAGQGPLGDNDPEDFVGQASVALTYLAHPVPFQDAFLAKPGAVRLFLEVFARFCGDVGAQVADPGEEMEQLKLREDEAEEAAERKRNRGKDAAERLTGKQLWERGLAGKVDEDEDGEDGIPVGGVEKLKVEA